MLAACNAVPGHNMTFVIIVLSLFLESDDDNTDDDVVHVKCARDR